MTAIEKAAAAVVALARSEIGYMEKATNAQLYDPTANAGSGNWTKYAAEIDALRGEYNFFNGSKNGFDWCAVFCCWNFIKLFGADMARKMLYAPIESCAAGCPYAANYYRANSAWLSGGQTPRPGDQIFFGAAKKETHTGLVAEVKDGRVYTIEGNANNRVQLRSYAINDGTIAGYGRPKYELVADRYNADAETVTPDTPIADDADTCTVELPWLREGDKGEYVKTLQQLLKLRASVFIVVDGDFGPRTAATLRSFQMLRKLVVDEVCGPQSWAALLKGG